MNALETLLARWAEASGSSRVRYLPLAPDTLSNLAAALVLIQTTTSLLQKLEKNNHVAPQDGALE